MSQEPFIAPLEERKEPRARRSRNAVYCEFGETQWMKKGGRELMIKLEKRSWGLGFGGRREMERK